MTMMTSMCAKPWKRLRSNIGLLALASCTLGMNILTILFNFYYVKVFLERYRITSSWLSFAQTMYMVCNFVIGPFIAFAQDYGFVMCRNRRHLVLIVGPLFALAFLLPWIPWYDIDASTEDGSGDWKPGVHLMMVLILWNILFALLSSCNSGLFAEFSTDAKKRVTALTCNQMASALAASAVFPVDTLSASVTDFRSFQIACGFVAAVAAACFVFTGLKASDVVAQTGKERMDAEEPSEEESKRIIPLTTEPKVQSGPHCLKPLVAYLTTVYQILRTRNYVSALIANCMCFLRVCVINNFLAVYTRGLISEDVLPNGSIAIAAFYLVSQVTPRVVVVLCCPLIKWCGPYKALQGSLILTWVNSAVGIYLGYFVCYNALIGTLLVECVLVAFQELFVIFYSEVVDQDAKKHQRKLPASTVVFAMTAIFIQPSTALAPMIVIRALNIGDYDKYKQNMNLAPPYTKEVMFLVSTCLPAFAAIVSFLSMCLYKTEEKPRRNRLPITRL